MSSFIKEGVGSILCKNEILSNNVGQTLACISTTTSLILENISFESTFVMSENVSLSSSDNRGWSDGAKVLGKLPVPGRPTILITVGQGPTALAVGAGGGCLDIFTLIYPFSSLSPSLWETARYRLKYCLKGPLRW